MLRFIFSLFMLFSTNVAIAAEPLLCEKWPSSIEEDMRITESDLTKAAADDAAKYLRKLVNEKTKSYDWTEPLNANQIIQGYLRKKDAIEALKRAEPGETPHEVQYFCEWLAERGFWYD
jgi:hypothetical protein